MQIDGGGDGDVETSLLEASNLIVLKVWYWPSISCSILLLGFSSNFLVYFVAQGSSVIHSNANLGVHGQGLLNLSGPGDFIEAQRLVLSLFYSINVSGNIF